MRTHRSTNAGAKVQLKDSTGSYFDALAAARRASARDGASHKSDRIGFGRAERARRASARDGASQSHPLRQQAETGP